MDEDRKAMAMQLWQPTTESLKDWTKSMLWFQNNTIQQQRAKFSTDHDNDIKNNFTASVSTTDHSVAKECNTATRIWLVAKWIRDWYNSNDIYDYDWMEDAPLVDAYKSTYPEYEDKIWEFVLDESQICDPSDLYESLWFYWKEKIGIDSNTMEDESPDNFVDWVKNVGKSFLSFFETWGSTVRNVVNGVLDEIDQGTVLNPRDTDYTMSARENYAYMNYWKSYYSLTDEQKKEANEILSTEEWMDKYKPTPQRAILKWLEAWLDAAFTIYAPYVKWWFSVWENTPWISDLLEIAWTIMQWGWWLVNHISPLYFYRDTLQTEEEKQEFDSFVGTLWFMKLFQKRWWRTEWNVKETLLKEIDPETTIKEFKKRITDAPADIKEWWINMKYWKATQENLEETAGKIAGAKTVEEQQTATRALQDSDIKWSKDYETLTARLKKRWEEIEAEEDIEYSMDERKFKPEDTRSIKEFEKDGYKSAVMLKPVEDWIALLKDFYEWSPEKTAQLDLIEQKFHNEWLTKWEINNISRAISQEYETYKERGQQKTSIAAKDVEDIRRAVKNFAREWNDRLVQLDKQRSDNMNTRAMVKDLQNAIVKFKTGKKTKNVFQKLAWVAADIFAYFWWKEFLWKILKNAVWENSYTPVLREADLKSLTNKFTKLNEKINWSKNKAEAEKIIDDFNKEMEKEYWPIEWEIIDTEKEWYSDWNKYLEDKVEINQ